MKLFLAGANSFIKVVLLIKYHCKYLLVSFNDLRIVKDSRNLHQILWKYPKKQELPVKWKDILSTFSEVMVDSGAFSYMSGTKTKIKKKELDEYTESYGRWLKDNKNYYNYYEEMDLDFLIGLKEVEEYRKYLEKCAGKQCIPVWHINRGLEYWKKMVKDYGYVAIGGLVSGEIKEMEKYAPFLIDIAHKNNCKVHGLGYTKTKLLKFIPWDSIDSSSWVFGGKRGCYDIFDGKKIKRLDLAKVNKDKTKIYYKDFHDMSAKTWVNYANYIEDYWERQGEEFSIREKD